MPSDALVWGATLVFVVWRLEGLLGRLWRDRQALADRELQLRERELTLAEQRQAPSLDPDEMPVDLAMRCASETEDWAREQLQSLVHQLHGKHKNWDSVRAELMKLDLASASAEPGWSNTRVAA